MDRRSFLKAGALGAVAVAGMRFLGAAIPAAHAADGLHGVAGR